MTRVALYCRISSDREGEGLGVARQEEDCRQLAERLGWDIAASHVDNDRSAYSGKRRPEYEALLAGIEAGRYDALIAWHPDRLHRSPKELERFIDIVERHRVQIATVQAGTVDLATPTGRMTARVVGAVARHESEHKAERLRRKHLELARAGKISGGGRRAFGYRNTLSERGQIVAVDVVPEEAALIVEAVERILAGDRVTAICLDWHHRGIATTTGAQWSPTTMRRMLASPRIAGMRTHHGDAVATAGWPAIIDYDTLLRLRGVLRQRGMRTETVARRYLLSGLLKCGRCGAQMSTRPTARGVRRYLCSALRGGCDRCGIAAQQTEDLVVETMLEVLPNLPAVMQRSDGREDSPAVELAEVDGRLEELALLWGNGDLTAVEWSVARAELMKRRQAALDRVAVDSAQSAIVDLLAEGGDIATVWAARDFAQRRRLVLAMVESVVIAPTVRANNRFDHSRVTVNWRH